MLKRKEWKEEKIELRNREMERWNEGRNGIKNETEEWNLFEHGAQIGSDEKNFSHFEL